MRRGLVGVTDARHASNVDCIDFPEGASIVVSRDALVVGPSFIRRVFAFFSGSGEGEGRAGESTRSSVSIEPGRGGVEGRSKMVLVSAGSVLERCMGARLLRLVTLGGSSTDTGDKDFSRCSCGGASIRGFTGDGDDKSMKSSCGCVAGRDGDRGRSETFSCDCARARANLKPGLVTFANVSIRACG